VTTSEPRSDGGVIGRSFSPVFKVAYVLTVSSGGLVIAASLHRLATEPVALSWFILVVLTLVSGIATLRLPNAPASFSISDSFTIAAALLFGPAAGAVTVAVDTIAISLQLARRDFRLQRFLFNVAAPPLAMWIAAHCFFWMAGVQPLIEDQGPLARLFAPLFVFTALYFVLNTGMIACAISCAQRRGPIGIWRRYFLPLWVAHFGGAGVAVLLITLVHSHGADLTVLAVVAPMPLVLYAMFKHAMGRVKDQLSHLEHVNKMHLSTIETLAHAIDAKDQVTHGHLRRVQGRAVRLATALGIEDGPDRRAIEAASLLHDLGKLAVPEHILNKPGKLTPAELETMRQHASIGADILSSIDFPYPVVPIVRHHHENWDGTGYPNGLKGEGIPIGARILAVVDCFDALTSDRPYRPKMDTAEAVAILQERSGTMYDPQIVATFVDLQSTEPSEDEQASTPGAFTMISETAQSDAVRRTVHSGSGDPSLMGIMFDAGAAIAADVRSLDVSLHDALAQIMPATCTAVYVFDAATDQLIGKHVAGSYATALRGLAIPMGQRVTGWVAARRSTIRNSDAALDLGSLTMQLSPRPRSCLSTALSVGETTVGALTVYSTSPDPFTEYHAAVVQALAPRIAAACLKHGRGASTPRASALYPVAVPNAYSDRSGASAAANEFLIGT